MADNLDGFTLRDYQQLAVEHGLRGLATGGTGYRCLYTAPTGSGKSLMKLLTQRRARRELGLNPWIITPRVEIVAGMLDKLGLPAADLTVDEVVAAGLEQRITTPIRYKQMLLFGGHAQADALLIDEAHHDEAVTWKHIHALCAYPPTLGYTATGFRGTPAGTKALHETWGLPQPILTYPEAVDRGVIAMPSCSTLALVDDDLIEIERGELVLSKVNSAVKSRVGQVAEYCQRFGGNVGQLWDRPTMFALPSRETAHTLATALRGVGLHATVVDGDTPPNQRQVIFNAVVARVTALVQIMVVSEGVDLPIRRLIDLRPTMSPVIWLQLVGRIMRPVPSGEQQPEYVCCNRNLIRHGYLLEGCLPIATFKEAQAAWPTPSKRAAARALGLEAIGRFKPSFVPLADGVQVTTYSVCAMEGHQRTDYFCVIHPAKADPVWASVRHGRNPDGTLSYGRWSRCDAPAELTGFASTPPNPLSEKQTAFWNHAAARYGLKKDHKVTKQQFQILPVAANVSEVAELCRIR